MTKILLCNCSKLTDEMTYKKAYRLVSAFRQTKADACKVAMDRARCIGAGLLLREAFFSCGSFEIDPEDGRDSLKPEVTEKDSHVLLGPVEYTLQELLGDGPKERQAAYERMKEKETSDARGRTFLEGEGKMPDQITGQWPSRIPYISISHSGDYAALALSEHPVGLDIQMTRSFSDGMVRKILAPSEKTEYEKLLNPIAAAAEDQISQEVCERKAEDYLLSAWCRKEAAAKLDGRGIFAMLSELSRDGWQENLGITTQPFFFHDGYTGAIAFSSVE